MKYLNKFSADIIANIVPIGSEYFDALAQGANLIIEKLALFLRHLLVDYFPHYTIEQGHLLPYLLDDKVILDIPLLIAFVENLHITVIHSVRFTELLELVCWNLLLSSCKLNFMQPIKLYRKDYMC